MAAVLALAESAYRQSCIPTWSPELEERSVQLAGWTCSFAYGEVPNIPGVGRCFIRMLSGRHALKFPEDGELYPFEGPSEFFRPGAARGMAVNGKTDFVCCLFQCLAPDGVDLGGEELDAAIVAIEEEMSLHDASISATVIYPTTKTEDASSEDLH